MEQILGRELTRFETVHHKNHNKLDNRPENLEVISLSEHARIHAIERGFGKNRIGVSPINKLSEEKINEIKKLRQDGMLLKEIKNATGLSWTTVQKYANYNSQ